MVGRSPKVAIRCDYASHKNTFCGLRVRDGEKKFGGEKERNLKREGVLKERL